MYKEFADIEGNADEVRAKGDEVGIQSVHVRDDSFKRMTDNGEITVTRMYFQSLDDYNMMVASYPDTFLLVRIKGKK